MSGVRTWSALCAGVAIFVVIAAGLPVRADESASTAEVEAPANVQASPEPPPASTPAPAPNDAGGTRPIDDRLTQLSKRAFDLDRAAGSARLDVESATRRFEAAQHRLDVESDPSESLREEVAARRVELEAAQRRVSLIQDGIARLDRAKRFEQRLQALAVGRVAPEAIGEWDADTRESLEELTREATVKQARIDEIERDLAFTREQIEAAQGTTGPVRWANVRHTSLERLHEQFLQDAEDIAAVRARAQSLEEQLARAQEDLPLGDQLRSMLHSVRSWLDFQITGSEPEPITVGKIIGAILIFLIGWAIARLVSGVLGSRVLPGLKMEEGAAQSFQSLAFYILVIAAFLTALRMVDIPLTAFAVVGGALAIGVGFGSQNVVNNFISGIILLAERPIKRNDLIEVGGVFGNVEAIGLRSTRVRTGDNVHMIVPNASFLESNVVNWTHSDAKVRVTISVGVAYGSPTREVESLILEAVRAQEGILPDPAPIVLFTDFGDNALGFEARFWIEMRTMMARLRIESEVRHRIDAIFREADIVIAFPQRDVHIDSLSPVEVRLLGEASVKPEAAES